MQADELYRKAEKKVNSFKIPFLMDEQFIYNDAAELYEKAGHIYKSNSLYNDAIKSYEKAGRYYIVSNDEYQSINILDKAAKLYTKIGNDEEAIKLYLNMINILKSSGRFTQMGKTYVEIAEIYQKADAIDLVIEYYELAVESFEMDNNKLWGKYAIKLSDYLVIIDKYDIAIKWYERLAREYVEDNLLQYQVKKILYKALLCQLMINSQEDMSDKLRGYDLIDARFCSTREYKFITKIVNIDDIEEFQDILREYDNLSAFDSWEIMILSRIKGRMREMLEYIDLA